MEAMGWYNPPPRKPTKTREQLLRERVERIRRLMEEGFLNSRVIIEAMMRAPREEFIPMESATTYTPR